MLDCIHLPKEDYDLPTLRTVRGLHAVGESEVKDIPEQQGYWWILLWYAFF
jgi:hypothetical protein